MAYAAKVAAAPSLAGRPPPAVTNNTDILAEIADLGSPAPFLMGSADGAPAPYLPSGGRRSRREVLGGLSEACPKNALSTCNVCVLSCPRRGSGSIRRR